MEASDLPIPTFNHRVPQVFYNEYRRPIQIARNELYFSKKPPSHSFLRSFQHEELLDLLGSPQFRQITFFRTYALGDIIACLPFIRVMAKMFPDKRINLGCPSHFSFFVNNNPTVGHLSVVRNDSSKQASSNEMFVNLDNHTFEEDHSFTNSLRLFHRTDILYHLFQVPTSERKYDYSIRIEPKYLQGALRFLKYQNFEAGKYVLFNWRAAANNSAKTLKPELRAHIINSLAKKNKVVVLHNDPIPEKWSHPNIHWAEHLPLQIAMGLAKHSSAVITTDTGTLWFSYAMKVPVICYLGPFQEAVRLSRHPLYPDQVRGINLLPLVGCPQECYQVIGNSWCQGKMSCMQDPDPIKLTELTLKALADIRR